MKLLIVDDEYHIRTGLQQAIDWKELGIHEAFIAENGEEAMTMVKLLRPEIVISDILMPEIDGLTLAQNILIFDPSTKIILLSGYSEFEYARKAIQIGICHYELKPISVPALTEAVKEAIVSYRKSVQLHELSRDKLALQVLTGELEHPEQIQDVLSELFGYGWFCGHEAVVATVSLDSHTNASSAQLAVLNTKIKEVLHRHRAMIRGVVIPCNDGQFAILCDIPQSASAHIREDWIRYSDSVNQELHLTHSITLSFGISNICSISSIPQLYRQSIQALEYRLYRSLSFYEEHAHFEQAIFYDLDEIEWKEIILTLNDSMIAERISKEFMRISEKEIWKEQDIKHFSIQLIQLLLRTVKTEYKYFDIMAKEAISDANFNLNRGTIEAYSHWVQLIYQNILSVLREYKGIKHQKTMISVLKYLAEHFQEDLSVEKVADTIGKTPNYFSHLFKKEMGVSFSEYLNRLRIQEAKRLLAETDGLAYEISEIVGYNDYKHFALVFKKMTGVSPVDFRNNQYHH